MARTNGRPRPSIDRRPAARRPRPSSGRSSISRWCVAAAFALLCLGALWPQPAWALVGAEPSPSATELWERYPLHQTTAPDAGRDPTPSVSPSASPATPDRAPEGGSRPGDDGAARGDGRLLRLALAVAAGSGVGFLVLLVDSRRRRPPAPARSARPSSPARPLRPVERARPDPGRRLPAGAPGAPAGAGAGAGAKRPADTSGPPRPLPPEPALEWMAEIEWRQTVGNPRFHVIARSGGKREATIAMSPPIAWPPRDGASLDALAEAVRDLDTQLVAGGWVPSEPGSAWYAKRFTWSPASGRERSPASTPGAARGRARAAPARRP